MFRFETLDIWRLAKDYCKECYEIARSFPDFEQYALSSQLRRAAFSVVNNISEGSGCESNKNFCRYLNISIHSLYETVNIIIYAEEMEYIDSSKKEKMYKDAEILIRKIKSFKSSITN